MAARCPSGVGLLLLDLDGTIVRDGLEVSPRVVTALRRAHEAGICLVVSTGRPIQMLPTAVRRLELMDFFLCSNGAKAYDAEFRELEARLIEHEDALRLMDALAPLSPGWNVMSNGRAWIEQSAISYLVGNTRALRARLRQRLPRSPRQLFLLLRSAIRVFLGEPGRLVVPTIEPVVDKHDAFEKFGCSFETEELCDEAVRIIDELGGFTVARVFPLELEITAQGVDKGSLADWLYEYLGVDRASSVAFGDSMNDATLIGHVGRFVAMGNSCDELKARADELCESIQEDGVACWIERALDESRR